MLNYLDDGETLYEVEGPQDEYTDGPSNVAVVDEGFDGDLEPSAEETVGDVGSHHL